MANQMIALQARAPQAPNIGAAVAQYGNMMANMANMDKMRRERAEAAAVRDIMSDASFNPTNPESLNKLIGLGPTGVEAASKIMQGQKLSGDLVTTRQAQAEKRVGLVGANLLGLLRDPSDATLAQTIETFKSVGMDPAEYQGVMAQLSQMPDPNQRKTFALQFIAQSPGARDALKYVMPDVKSEKIGDAQVFLDNNANSPTFGQELFRITASPEPVKLNQQVVDSTLYNVNPITGVAQEATVGDATASLIPGPRTLTRTDTGVVSPYAVGGAPAFAPPPPAAPTAAAPDMGAPPVTQRGITGVKSALQTNPGALKDGAFARSQPGYKGASGGFAVFDTPQQGIKAQENLLQSRYLGRGLNTVNKIIDTYAPEGPENSPASVRNYKAYIAQRTGLNINQPLSAQNIPAVASAMREFETGNRPGGRSPTRAPTPTPTAPATPTAPTIAEAQRQKAFKMAVDTVGYNPKTGTTRVENLIEQSTSGDVQMIGSQIVGAVTGTATKGRVALGQLKAIANNMTFEKLRGKLGAQISDADVRLIASTMGDIANGTIPANERAAAWNNVVLPLLQRGANLPPKTAVDALRKNPSLRNQFDGKYGSGSAAKVLGR
jgi:hypothetical protein